MKPATAKMTYEQYYLLSDNGKRYQLFDGELQEMSPAPTPRHQEILGRIYAALASYVEKHARGKVYIAPIDVVFDEHTVLQPDVIFIRNERLAIVGPRAVEGAPDLAVEILSPSTFYDDLRRKMLVYEKFGISEYWIVDPEKPAVQVYRRKGSALELDHSYASQDAIESTVLAGLRLPVQSIF